jgi:prepilin-type N-terminal cleavage/methylation domain-containing protein
MKNIKNGFTLIEIVITMGIIAILLSSISFAFVQAIERMKVNRAVSDIQAIRQAVEQYHA